jgi:hypothetical protein
MHVELESYMRRLAAFEGEGSPAARACDSLTKCGKYGGGCLGLTECGEFV